MATDRHDEAAIEAGRRLFAQECRFVIGAVSESQLPVDDTVEIAFAGRSNVGKSSLVNALTGCKTLARTSNTPGRTREVNLFALGDALRLVDLPGYGYARAAKTRVASWTRLIERYLGGRPNLRRVCLLIDARHGPKDSDRDVMAELDRAAVSYQIVLTKCDKLPGAALDALVARLGAEMPKHTACHPDVVRTSARTGAGIAELRAELASLVTNQ